MQKENLPGFAMTRRSILGGMAASVTAGLFSPPSWKPAIRSLAHRLAIMKDQTPQTTL